jgi:uncharacterized RDD family membrane protein YckC
MHENPYAAPRVDVNQGMGYAPQADERPLASLGARFGARFLDGLVEAGPLVVLSIVGGVLTATGGGEPSAAGIVLILLGYLSYIVLWILNVVRLVKTGQTWGKKWCRVQVVRMDGYPVTFGNHFVRGLILAVAGIIDVVFIFRSDRRCLHDLAAETKVIATD